MSSGHEDAPGLVDAYIASVRRSLGGAAVERFLAEIHEHLRDATADGLRRGLEQAEAEARAIELFGAAEVVAGQYAAELAEATWEKHLHVLRLVAIAFVLLTLYYARFFLAVRQEGATLVQIGVLLAGAAVLTLPARPARASTPWFRSWQPVSLQGWAIVVVALGFGAAFFAWVDHDSHSASDMLNRAIPTLCLIAAIALRIAHQRDASRLRPTAT
jgi:hypothetical protein